MCTLDTKYMEKAGFVYLLVSIFCIVFGAVYEHFSHEVYSGYMIYAFALPLAGGTLPCYVMIFRKFCPCRLAFNLYNSGVAALTVGCVIKGVLDIYGTSNELVWTYVIVGGLLVAAALLAELVWGGKE